MKFERNKNSKKYFLCGLIMVVVLTVTVTFITSKANYRMTASIPLTEGKVISSPYDFNIVAMYIDGVEQSKETTMPGKGYVLTSDSYCYKGTDKNNKDNNVILETNKYGEHIISELSKSSKCILYFKRREATTSAASYILSHITEVTHRKRGTFTQAIEGETTGKIYADSDDDGVTYYYAGNPTDNWVEFGDYYWRIIRINGNGSIRMIYQGTEPNATGEGTQIGTSRFNNFKDDCKYVGYWFADNDVHGLTEPSTIYTKLNDWFKNTSGLTNEIYFSKIDLNSGFCNDRTAYLSLDATGTPGLGDTLTTFGPYKRYENSKPTFNCEIQEKDLFTFRGNDKYSSSYIGNKILENPVGMITLDEATYAGVIRTPVKNNYLNTNMVYWTISPSLNLGSSNNNGIIAANIWNYGAFGSNSVVNNFGIRPVINIRPDVTLTGDGTVSNPYKVV
ncbi:MAG: hypothetical protein NC483_05890 [Ruminococcus sp.]|nr:hypothetical protein [Ruminococcus sp.]